jgi:hypothetical protein
MYPKQITELILDLQAKGYTAQLTQRWIKDNNQIHIGLQTIYRHRTSALAHEIVEAMAVQQQQDITIESQRGSREVAMKYRNEFLKIMLPQMSIALTKNINETSNEIHHVIEFVDPDNPAQTYPSSEVQAAQRAGIIPQL